MPVHGIREGIGRHVGVCKTLREGATLVEHAAAGHMTALEAAVRYMLEIAIGMRIVQGTMLGEALDVIGALHLMQHGHVAVVGAGDDVALAIEVEAPGVAAALGKQLEFVGDGMVAPNALLKLDAADVGRYGAALSTVQP